MIIKRICDNCGVYMVEIVFENILEEKKPIIWEEVDKYLLKEGDYNFSNIVNEYSRRQGKYGRGTLVLLSCEAFGGDYNKAIRTAAAIQLSEDWLLIHDDWQDDSEKRRGKLTLHKWCRKYFGINSGDYFAINAGDALHTIMWKTLIDNREIFDDETTYRILNEFYRFLIITTQGQHLELYNLYYKDLENLTYEDYDKIVFGKTCEYTIAGPLRLGAIIAGQDEKILKQLSEVGVPLGKAFQIKDDLLNVEGKASEYGKEIGGDIYEGKRTLMLIHLIKHTEGKEHDLVINIMNKPRYKKTQKEVNYILELMKECGSIAFAEKKAEEFGDIAKKRFNDYFSYIPNKEVFNAAIDFFAKTRRV